LHQSSGSAAGTGDLPDDFFDEESKAMGAAGAVDVAQVNVKVDVAQVNVKVDVSQVNVKAAPLLPPAPAAAAAVNLDSEMEVTTAARPSSCADPSHSTVYAYLHSLSCRQALDAAITHAVAAASAAEEENSKEIKFVLFDCHFWRSSVAFLMHHSEVLARAATLEDNSDKQRLLVHCGSLIYSIVVLTYLGRRLRIERLQSSELLPL
jgi:hypothetical protein